jgi:hypothetical protein
VFARHTSFSGSTGHENTKRQDSAACAGGVCDYFYLLCTPMVHIHHRC